MRPEELSSDEDTGHHANTPNVLSLSHYVIALIWTLDRAEYKLQRKTIKISKIVSIHKIIYVTRIRVPLPWIRSVSRQKNPLNNHPRVPAQNMITQTYSKNGLESNFFEIFVILFWFQRSACASTVDQSITVRLAN